MKKIFVLLVTLLLCVACGSHSMKDEIGENRDTVQPLCEIQTGDLLFVGLPMSYSLAPDAQNEPANEQTCAGDSLNLIHVAILEVSNDTTWVIDATLKHNVARYPLDTFLTDFTLTDGSHPLFIIKRLKDNSAAKQYVENAKKFVGRQYDIRFLSENEEQFCSELVRNSYVTDNGEFIFSEYPMNFQKANGTFPIYWEQLFQLIKFDIPQGKLGTTPAQMMQESCLQTVNCSLLKH